jgi:predicted PurR-regulated permease PerM
MEGVAGLSVVLIVCVGIVLAILLILMPVFVFQISNSAERIEKAVKEILSSTVRTENSTNQILIELHKTNTHFIPPAE